MARPSFSSPALLLALVAPLALAQTPTQAGDPVMQAMRDELARSVQQLRLDTLAKPYFIAYRISEDHSTASSARLGSLVAMGAGLGSRFLQVEVRVGDYTFDNTNFFGAGYMPSSYVGFGMIPLDDDYQEIRRQLWLSTDRAYKQALEALSQKRAVLETRSRAEEVPDFSHEPVTNTVEEIPAPPADRAAAEALARDLSAVFRNMPEIYNSNVSVGVGSSRVRYLNSEGTSYVRSIPSAGVSVLASTQAPDGMSLADAYSANGRSLADLPGRDSLLAAARGLATRLSRLRQTPLADSYDGPVLFEGDAAGELVNSVLAPKLVALRRPVTSPTYDRMMATATNDWTDLIGSRVLPRFLSVVDDPTSRTVQGVTLEGHRVDDDGVTTKATTVIDHGTLKTLLAGRVPIAGIDHSTGNRTIYGVLPTHVIVTADSGSTPDELRRKLLALATEQGRDYAIVVRRLSNPRATGTLDPEAFAMSMGMGSAAEPPIRALVAVKVFADGREEPVRGADITGLGPASFKEIVAVSKSQNVYRTVYMSRANIFAGGGGIGSVAYVTPSLLFPNVSIRKPRGSNPKPPVVPPPGV